MVKFGSDLKRLLSRYCGSLFLEVELLTALQAISGTTATASSPDIPFLFMCSSMSHTLVNGRTGECAARPARGAINLQPQRPPAYVETLRARRCSLLDHHVQVGMEHQAFTYQHRGAEDGKRSSPRKDQEAVRRERR